MRCSGAMGFAASPVPVGGIMAWAMTRRESAVITIGVAASVGAINPITKPIAVNRIIIARFSDQTLHANL
jgi:hypothetical protein